MRLKHIKYSEFESRPLEWVLEGISFGSKNLVVGRNTSGKSRVLKVVHGISQLLSGTLTPAISGKYECSFQHENQIFDYLLHYENEEVIQEVLHIDGIKLLRRETGGEGAIYTKELNRNMRFQTPTNQIASVARRDSIQHNFLEPLYEWATTVRHFQFGSNLGKESLAVVSKNAPEVDDRDQKKVVAIFRTALKEFGSVFQESVISDLEKVDYYVEEINVGPLASIRIEGEAPDIVGLYVREKDLAGITDQISMSQGMFRVLSLLIFTNYFKLRNCNSCLLIDDIGEGLDYERSCKLIALLREKAEASKIQLIMSTNDRFVMNEVPLDEWSILQRNGSRVAVRNMHNSAKEFEEFKFTGMSNFSIIEHGFLE